VRALLASFVVPTGQVVWTLSQTRTSADFAAHLRHVVHQLSAMARYDWVVDNLNTHWSLDVCRLVAQGCQVPFVATALRRGRQRRAFLRALVPFDVIRSRAQYFWTLWLERVKILPRGISLSSGEGTHDINANTMRALWL
jgi:hypothetical protein